MIKTKMIAGFNILLLSILLNISAAWATRHSKTFTVNELHTSAELIQAFTGSRSLSRRFQHEPELLKIEIGAASTPLCSDCVQVDKYASQYHLFLDSEYITLKRRAPSDLLRHLNQRRGGLGRPQTREAFLKPWAAAQGGIIADAQNLAFQDGTVSFLVSKCFPWFLYDGSSVEHEANTRRLILSVLQEYKRVLAPDGMLLLMAGSIANTGDGLNQFIPHAFIAAELGFDVIPVPAVRNKTRATEAIILVHRKSPCSQLLCQK